MAKSLRSKTKRNHRAAKRTKGDYAVADAARLGRLNEKLNAIKSGKAGKTDEEDDMQGWLGLPPWIVFGLLDGDDMTPDVMGAPFGNDGPAIRLHDLVADISSPIEAEDVSPDQPTTTTTTTESLPGMHIPFPPFNYSLGADTTTMQVDEKKVSTHGPRNSRREEWRLSKGLTAFPTSKGMNRQGGLAAKRKPGRSQRRR